MRRVGRNDMAHPAEQAAGANPESRRDDQPEDPAKEITVINLSNPRKDQAENRGSARIPQIAGSSRVAVGQISRLLQ